MDSELEELAFHPGTTRHKALSLDQLEQIHQSAKFEVSSIQVPAQNHVWKLSILLQTGSQALKHARNHTLAQALGQLIVELPNRIWSSGSITSPSLRNAFYSIRRGIKEIPRMVIGWREVKNKYSEIDIRKKVREERAKWLDKQPHPLGMTLEQLMDHLTEVSDRCFFFLLLFLSWNSHFFLLFFSEGIGVQT
jgi:hypothetical protein